MKQKAIRALETFYRYKGNSGKKAELQWTAVLAMNAYYKSSDNASRAKKEMQVEIDRLQKETGTRYPPKFSEKERRDAVKKLGVVVDAGMLDGGAAEEKKIPKGSEFGVLGILLVCLLVLWYFLLGNIRRG